MVIKKRGMFFTIDAILATSIIIIAIILASSYYVKETKTETIDYMGHDLVRVLTNLKVNEIDNDYVSLLISEGNITRNNTILEQIGEFWSEDKIGQASELTRNITSSLIPKRYGFGIWVNDELIYTRNIPIRRSLVSSRKLISGIAKDKPVEGYTSRVFLSGLKEKTVYSYIYFGGFVGNGNITVNITLPGEIINITEVYMEMAASNNFSLLINSQSAGSYLDQFSDDLRADKWYLNESYHDLLNPGNNQIRINFNGSPSYIGGGFIRVNSVTSNINYSEITYQGDQVIKKEQLPGIEGIINLYSSFYVPGNLTSLQAYLHLDSNYTTFFNVGNDTIYYANPDGEAFLNIDDAYFRSILNYNNLNNNTVPYRIGLAGASYGGFIGKADSILVTDVSGSMGWCGEYSIPLTCNYNCLFGGSKSCVVSDPSDCSGNVCGGGCFIPYGHNLDCVRTRLEIAQDSGKVFVNTILQNINNRVGLASYESDLDDFTDLTNNNDTLVADIEGYTADGGTCICCGIYKANDMLPHQEKEFIVVISDGDANYKCSGPGDYTGEYDSANAPQSAIDAGNYSCNNNITVFTIGFGSDISASGTDTLKSVACNESLYFNATNTSLLTNILSNISSQILEISYAAQSAVSTGGFEKSTLYSDSYIEFTYTPYVEPYVYGKIPVNFETEVFGNYISQGVLDIPAGISVADAKVTSYSGDKWTDNVTLTNTNTYDVFNLSSFNNNYTGLGDPFLVNIKPELIEEGINTVTVSTGLSLTNNSGGSPDNRVIYTLLYPNSLSYTSIAEKADGCIWSIKYEYGSNTTIAVPLDYSGSDSCDFETGVYDSDDSIDVAFYSLLGALDFDDDGLLDLNFGEEFLFIENIAIAGVPSLWGPAVMEIRVWE